MAKRTNAAKAANSKKQNSSAPNANAAPSLKSAGESVCSPASFENKEENFKLDPVVAIELASKEEENLNNEAPASLELKQSRTQGLRKFDKFN